MVEQAMAVALAVVTWKEQTWRVCSRKLCSTQAHRLLATSNSNNRHCGNNSSSKEWHPSSRLEEACNLLQGWDLRMRGSGSSPEGQMRTSKAHGATKRSSKSQFWNSKS